MVNKMLQAILTSLSIFTIILAILFALLKKWFLDLETYKRDRLQCEQHRQEDTDSLKRYTNDLKASEDKLLEKFEKMLQDLKKEKASAEDLAKANARIEKLDDRIAELTTNMEKQSYRLDILIENRTEIIDVFKDFKAELNEHLKSVREDVAEVKKTNTRMQLDIQAVKSRLG